MSIDKEGGVLMQIRENEIILQKNEYDEIIQENEKFLTAASMAFSSIWEINFEDGYMKKYSESSEYIYNQNDYMHISQYYLRELDYINYEEQERFAAEMEPSVIQEELKKSQQLVREYRLKKFDGRYCWTQYILKRVSDDYENVVLLLKRNIQDEKDMQDNLKESLQKAEFGNLEKMDFLSRISHEMRTRLNVISGLTQLSRMVEPSEEIKENLYNIEQSANALSDLINHAFDFSMMEEDKVQLQAQKFNLKDMLLMLEHEMKEKSRERGLEFILEDIKLQHYIYLFDQDKIIQILKHLIANAVKFNRVGGYVKLSVEEKEVRDNKAYITYIVEDNGIGMSEEFQKTQMYHLYQQERNSNLPEIMGVGLGLALTKSIVSLLGGDIQVSSKLDRGTKITVTIPQLICDGEVSVEQNVHQQYDFSGKKALVVEDNEININIVSAFLNQTGIVYDIARNGEEAVSKFRLSRENEYNVILMDIKMPILSGTEAAKQIRSMNREDALTVPIFAMTANVLQEDVAKVFSSGMNDHISKPIMMNDLFYRLNRVLG